MPLTIIASGLHLIDIITDGVQDESLSLDVCYNEPVLEKIDLVCP
jgi:hypothetical protein